MSFDPYNYPLKIWESIGTPTPKVGIHLGVWGFIPSHSFAFTGVWKCDSWVHSWPAPLWTVALVVNRKLRLRHQDSQVGVPKLGLLLFWNFECKYLPQIKPFWNMQGHYLIAFKTIFLMVYYMFQLEII
jgi:hypothetical protein